MGLMPTFSIGYSEVGSGSVIDRFDVVPQLDGTTLVNSTRRWDRQEQLASCPLSGRV